MSRALCLQKVLSKRHSSCCIRTCRSLPVSAVPACRVIYAVPACRVVRELFVVSTWPLCSVLSYSGLLVVSQPAPICPFLLWPVGRVPTCPALSFPTLACWSCPNLPRSVLSYSGLLVVSQPAPLCPFLLWPPGRVPLCPGLHLFLVPMRSTGC